MKKFFSVALLALVCVTMQAQWVSIPVAERTSDVLAEQVQIYEGRLSDLNGTYWNKWQVYSQMTKGFKEMTVYDSWCRCYTTQWTAYKFTPEEKKVIKDEWYAIKGQHDAVEELRDAASGAKRELDRRIAKARLDGSAGVPVHGIKANFN